MARVYLREQTIRKHRRTTSGLQLASGQQRTLIRPAILSLNNWSGPVAERWSILSPEADTKMGLLESENASNRRRHQRLPDESHRFCQLISSPPHSAGGVNILWRNAAMKRIRAGSRSTGMVVATIVIVAVIHTTAAFVPVPQHAAFRQGTTTASPQFTTVVTRPSIIAGCTRHQVRSTGTVAKPSQRASNILVRRSSKSEEASQHCHPTELPGLDPAISAAVTGNPPLSVTLDDGTQYSYNEAIQRTLGWVSAAIIFGGGLWAIAGAQAGEEFFAGYLVEQSLSVDNLFVFLLLFEYFKVPLQYQDRVLNWGIYGAIVMRAVMIGVGAAALQHFHAILLVFAAILVYSSARFFVGAGSSDEEDEDPSENSIIKFSHALIDSTDHFDGDRFFTVVEGVRKATPLFICMIAVEISDVVFAVDSIPAVFGVTEVSLRMGIYFVDTGIYRH